MQAHDDPELRARVRERLMRRYQPYGSERTGRWFVLDCAADELVSGPMNKRGAEMLADKMERALDGESDDAQSV